MRIQMNGKLFPHANTCGFIPGLYCAQRSSDFHVFARKHFLALVKTTLSIMMALILESMIL